MIKKLLLLTFGFFLMFTTSSFAHTGLKDSSPVNDEIVKEELKTITLTFETKIELSSTFKLENSNGESIPLEDISLNENQMVGNLTSPLDNDRYQVHWRIIGADGHPIEGEFTFQVDVPVDEAKEPEQKAKKETIKEPESSNSEEEDDQNNLPAYVIPGVIGILIALFVASFLSIMRRGK